MKRIWLVMIGVLVLLPVSARAATAYQQAIDDTQLVKLYEAYVKKGQADAYLDKRIAAERARIRSLIDGGLQTYITQNTDSEPLSTNVPKAIDRQRSLVSSLQGQLKERQADLSLLTQEQSAYDKSGSLPGSAGSLDTSTMASYPEILASRAITEERISALETVLQGQQDKLNLLNRDQLFEQYAFFITIASYLAMLLVVIGIERTVQRLLISRIQSLKRRYFFKKVISAFIYTLIGLWVLNQLLSEYPSVLASLAIVGAGLAVALQDVVKDFVAWIVIIQKRPFTLGNRITVGKSDETVTGDIIDIGMLRIALAEVGTMRQYDVLEHTGRTLFIPNSKILTEYVLNANTTSDFIKAETQLMVTFESDWCKAEKILKEIAEEETHDFTRQARRQYSKRTSLLYVSDEPNDSDVYMELAGSGILFTLRFYVPVGMRREVLSKITHKILVRFAKESSLHLAYTTTRSFSTMVSAPKGWAEGRA